MLVNRAEQTSEREEFQCAAGHLLAELQNVYDDLQRGRVTPEAYKQRVTVLKVRANAFRMRMVRSCARHRAVQQ